MDGGLVALFTQVKPFISQNKDGGVATADATATASEEKAPAKNSKLDKMASANLDDMFGDDDEEFFDDEE
jgi:hypothetical protein